MDNDNAGWFMIGMVAMCIILFVGAVIYKMGGDSKGYDICSDMSKDSCSTISCLKEYNIIPSDITTQACVEETMRLHDRYLPHP